MSHNRQSIRGHRYSKWCALFEDFAEGRKMPNAEIARRTGMTQFLIHSWMSGKILPPLDHRLVEMADAMELDGDERDAFEMEAYMAHTPDWIQHKMRALVDENRSLKKRLAGAVLSQDREPETLG